LGYLSSSAMLLPQQLKKAGTQQPQNDAAR
jgi:hypothetical protein